jgi:DnaD/phage-associated family protein
VSDFKGFGDQETFTRVPDAFFRQLLSAIDDLDELRVTLYTIWLVEHAEGAVRPLREADLRPLAGEAGTAVGLEQAVSRGSLLRVETDPPAYFLNTPRGRAAAEALRTGAKALAPGNLAPPPERPNVFRLYEQNIGPLTPLMADALKDAEASYSAAWVEEALAEAVTRNKRSWKYVEAILKRWKEEGRAEKQDRSDAPEDRRRDEQRKVEDFLRGR